jgi:hypothetical protein
LTRYLTPLALRRGQQVRPMNPKAIPEITASRILVEGK